MVVTVLGGAGVHAASGLVPSEAPAVVRPATVEGRVVQREPWPAAGSGEARFLVEVEEVLNGWLPSSVVVVTVAEASPDLALFRDGAGLHLVVVERPDGSYRVRSARPLIRSDPDSDPFPPPMAVTPREQPSPAPGIGALHIVPTPSYEQQVVELVNQQRWDYGGGHRPPLKQVDLLHNAAGGHSLSMAVNDFFSHIDPSSDPPCSDPGDRMTAAGYTASPGGENVAAGYLDPADVMNDVDGWMASEGHRNNILNTGFREIGVGYVHQAGDTNNVKLDANSDCVADDALPHGPYYDYWTQDFGKRNNVYPVVINREAYTTTSLSVNLYVYGTGWAVDMRFSNDGSSWSGWESFVADKAWALTGADGEKTVYAQIRNGGTTYQASDTIILDLCQHEDTIALSSDTVTGTESYTACTLISAGPSYNVQGPSGNLACHAPTVVLRNGFSVGSGATFTAGS